MLEMTVTVTKRILTDREEMVFDLMGQGLNTKKITGAMGIVPNTVESHRDNIKKKTGINDLSMLMREAVLYHEGKRKLTVNQHEEG
jgi:DNA-binding NarL/FixJ family response regulator